MFKVSAVACLCMNKACKESTDSFFLFHFFLTSPTSLHNFHRNKMKKKKGRRFFGLISLFGEHSFARTKFSMWGVPVVTC